MSILILQKKKTTLEIRRPVFCKLAVVQFCRQKYKHVAVRALCLQGFGRAEALFASRNQLERTGGPQQSRLAHVQQDSVFTLLSFSA